MKPRIGLVGLTAELYKEKWPGLVDELEKFSCTLRRVCSAFAEVYHVSAAYTKEQVSNAFDRFNNEKLDGVILVFLSYSPSKIIEPVIARFQGLPILIWNTQKLCAIGANFSMDDMLYNHGMHGVQDLANVLLRKKIKFSLITGHFEDASVISEVGLWCIAARVANYLKGARIGRIGGRFKDMGDFAIGDRTIFEKFGAPVLNIPVKRIAEESRKVTKRDIDGLMEEDRKRFDVDAGLDAETHFKSARMELALRKIIRDEHLAGLAINFTGFSGEEGSETIPFSAISKFLAEGFGYAGEGDVLCALSVLILQKLCGNANFVEMFTTDYQNNKVLISHMGESNPLTARAGSSIKLVKKPMDVTGPGIATAMMLFPFKPGPVTLFNIAPAHSSEFRLITAVAEIEDAPLFDGILSPHFILKTSRNVGNFLNEYSMLGGTHHLAMAYGDVRASIRHLAIMLNTPCFEI